MNQRLAPLIGRATTLCVYLLLGAGCASTLSTLQTARPVEPMHVQVTGGVGAYAPLGPTVAVVGQGFKQADAIRQAALRGEPYELSEEDQQELLTAGIALAVMPPSTGYEVSLRTGVVSDVDVGLRYSVNALRLDGKYRFFHQESDVSRGGWMRSFDLATGLGVSYYLFKNPLFDVLEFVEMDDFSRWDFELPIYASFELGEIVKLYGAAKYILSRTSFDPRLVDVSTSASEATGLDLRLPSSVNMHFFGLSGGIGLGYRYVHLLLELTAGYTHLNPVLFGRRRNLGGVTVYPAAALNLRF